tara:strand:+ start:218 stop:808 length:591 start_codon:yes stop_codon:yes gene_type:complete
MAWQPPPSTPCVLGTPVGESAVPMGIPVTSSVAPTQYPTVAPPAQHYQQPPPAQPRSAAPPNGRPIDTTGDGIADSIGYDTTGDGMIDTLRRLQGSDSRGQSSDEAQKRRAGRAYLEAAETAGRNEYPLASAKRLAHIAVEADEAGCGAEACRIYMSAVEWYMKASSVDPACKERERATMEMLLSRCEQLRGIQPP